MKTDEQTHEEHSQIQERMDKAERQNALKNPQQEAARVQRFKERQAFRVGARGSLDCHGD